ncbi:unnamed protein product, partial [marine sediment metagenome]
MNDLHKFTHAYEVTRRYNYIVRLIDYCGALLQN